MRFPGARSRTWMVRATGAALFLALFVRWPAPSRIGRLISLLPKGILRFAPHGSGQEARPPEMHPLTAAQLSAFLAWSGQHSELHPAWHLLASTGMRRGELTAAIAPTAPPAAPHRRTRP